MRLRFCRLLFASLITLLLTAAPNVFSASARETNLREIAILEDERAVDTTRIASWIRDSDDLVRKRTAYMIGIVGDSSYVPFLRELLRDKTHDVLTQAIFAAGQLNDSSLARDLIPFTSETDSSIKALVIDALSKIGSPPAIERLVAIVYDTNETIPARAAATRSLFRARDKKSAAALLSQARTHIPLLRQETYYALYRRATKDMQRELAAGLLDKLEQVQIYAALGVAKINDSTAIPALRSLLTGRNWRVRYHALEAIGKLKAKSLADDVAGLMDESENIYVRQAAMKALGDIGAKERANDLQIYTADKDINLSREAFNAVVKLKRDESYQLVQAFASSPDPRQRAATAAACEYLSDSLRVPILKELTTDKKPSVRLQAFDQLFGVKDTSISLQAIRMALTDSDMVPVTAACDKIASDSLIELVPEMCARYGNVNRANATEIHTAVLDALNELGARLPHEKVITDIVDAALQDLDFTIRKRAYELAAKLSITYIADGDHYESSITEENYSQVYGPFKRNPIAVIKTAKGEITIELRPDAAPKTVANFLKLVRDGFYDHRVWHRVVPDFVIQDGDPRGDGWGGPGYEIRSEDNDQPFMTGSVGMATSGKDTGGSQYFICQSPQPHLNGRYTLFGQVIKGMDVVEQIEYGDSVISVKVTDDGN